MRHEHSVASRPNISALRSLARWGTAAGLATVAYMAFEAQWVRCVSADLPVPHLPAAWSGVTVLHISDVHAGMHPLNERSLRKVVDWAVPLQPDLVVLTGDILNDPDRGRPCLKILSRLRPPLGTYAVTGNHEYGITKGPLAQPQAADRLWDSTPVTLLQDRCVLLPPRDGATLALCGADYLSGGFGLEPPPPSEKGTFLPILLVHEPPAPDSPLAHHFPLAFAAHAWRPDPRSQQPGLIPLNGQDGTGLSGLYDWGEGKLVVSGGIGTSFVPLRLMTRPEAMLWRLV